MAIKLRNEFIILNILVILLILIITLFPSNVLRIILGLPFVLFFPGYTFTACFFPRKTSIGTVERVALSFGLSIVVVSLIGLILNYIPWGIRLYPVLISVTVFILIFSAAAWYQRHELTPEERFVITLNLSLTSWKKQNRLDKILSLALLIVILGTASAAGYVMIQPKAGENLTEFYILETEGKMANYPSQMAAGQEGKVIVAIAHHRPEPVNYRLEVMIDGTKNNEITGIVLGQDEKWEQVVSFTLWQAGENQKVEFLLYRQGQKEAYRSIHLWVDVKKQD